ncbi:MAG: hypothetical protein Tsb0010_13660 [Parvularculaceae bacterium]
MSRWRVTKADLNPDREPGISGFMRLKNEAEFLDRAFESHLPALDELIVVYNDCTDKTPEICREWARRCPEKIKLFEYEPKVTPLGTPEAIEIDSGSENSLANYYNFSLCQTTRQIVFKVDGDHIMNPKRFAQICHRVRRRLKRNERWPVYGINLADTPAGVGVYNFYDFRPHHDGKPVGPPPFTAGDHCFYYVDETTWHDTDRDHGYEIMPISHKRRSRFAHDAYTFFHAKGLKSDQGTANWLEGEGENKRSEWIRNVRGSSADRVVSLAAMARANPSYFAGIDFAREFETLFPGRRLLGGRSELGFAGMAAAFKKAALDIYADLSLV